MLLSRIDMQFILNCLMIESDTNGYEAQSRHWVNSHTTVNLTMAVTFHDAAVVHLQSG